MGRNRLILGALCAAFLPYSVYVYTRGTDGRSAPPMSAEARHGQQVFQEYNCIACHQFYGLGGYMGPDLTNVMSNRGRPYARAFISTGTVAMPDLGLTDRQVDAVLDFLEFVDSTGTYPVETYTIRWYGTVAQADDP